MDLKKIKELVKILSTHNLEEISMEEKDFKITIKKSDTRVSSSRNVLENTSAVSTVLKPEINTSPKPNPNHITIKAPMIGTFYTSNGPNKEPFVKVGDGVKKGQVLCLIEAMKLFNEIESDVNGKILEIIHENASPVEFDQALFVIEKH